MQFDRKTTGALVAVLCAALLLASVVRMPAPQAYAAPDLAPTPVAGITVSNPASGVLTWLSNTRATADAASPALGVRNFQKCDISWDVDIEVGHVNTTTYTLQFSNDSTYWANGAAIASAVAADTGRSTTGSGNMQQFAVFGRYARVYVDVTNTSPVTNTFIGVCK